MYSHLSENEQIARHHIAERTREALEVHGHRPRGRERVARALRRAADRIDG